MKDNRTFVHIHTSKERKNVKYRKNKKTGKTGTGIKQKMIQNKEKGKTSAYATLLGQTRGEKKSPEKQVHIVGNNTQLSEGNLQHQ